MAGRPVTRPIDTGELGPISTLTPRPPRLVVIESPYAGDVAANVAYARRAVADSLARGEAPISSHLLYTQPGILDDLDPAQRAQGIAAGLAWSRVADFAAFYVDRGWSPGMRAARDFYRERNGTIDIRTIGDNPPSPPTWHSEVNKDRTAAEDLAR